MKEIDLLKQLLATTYSLYNKTQQIHWGLKDKRFLEFHAFFEEHYKDYQDSIDDLAELIIMSGSKVDLNLNKIIESSIIDSKIEKLDDIHSILDIMIKDHEEIIKFIENSYSNTEDLLIQDIYISRLSFHKKAVWMMKASNLK